MSCGCYELIPEEPPRRTGQLSLLSSAHDRLEEINVIDDIGVLDCSWLPPEPSGPRLLAVATSAGTAQLFELHGEPLDSQPLPELLAASKIVCEGSGVCMSLAWSESHHHHRLVVTSTSGMLYTAELLPTGLNLLHAWQVVFCTYVSVTA